MPVTAMAYAKPGQGISLSNFPKLATREGKKLLPFDYKQPVLEQCRRPDHEHNKFPFYYDLRRKENLIKKFDAL